MEQHTNFHNMLYAVWKEKGISSHKVIQALRKTTGEKRIGHAGTLDPLAEGILVIGIGRDATKRLWGEETNEKEYEARIRFGMESETDDEEGEKKEWEIKHIPTEEELKEVLQKFTGIIEQTPPQYSAVKIQGKEAYKLARKGKFADIKPRKAEIKFIKLLSYEWPFCTLQVCTGKGVYIRSLARDIGVTLQVGGYLAGLIRTRVGRFTKADVKSFAEFEICKHI